MGKHLVIESLDTLIKAVQEYQEELMVDWKILINAANACDAAMGSDDYSKKYIAKLYEALEELQKTAGLTSKVAEALIADRRAALATYED